MCSNSNTTFAHVNLRTSSFVSVRTLCKDEQTTSNIEDFERYKLAEKAATKAINEAKYEAYDDLYIKWEQRRGRTVSISLSR